MQELEHGNGSEDVKESQGHNFGNESSRNHSHNCDNTRGPKRRGYATARGQTYADSRSHSAREP